MVILRKITNLLKRFRFIKSDEIVIKLPVAQDEGELLKIEPVEPEESIKPSEQEYELIINEVTPPTQRIRNQSVWGDSSTTTGVIVDHVTTYQYRYYFINERKLRTFSNPVLKTLVAFATEFIEQDEQTVESFQRIKLKYKHTTKNRKKQYVVKHCNIRYGAVMTLEQKIEVWNYLEYKNWDLKYQARNICNYERTPAKEYYRAMHEIITFDKEYQKYLKMKDLMEGKED